MYPESACNVRNPGLIPGSGKSPGEGNGAAERTQLSNYTFTVHSNISHTSQGMKTA